MIFDIKEKSLIFTHTLYLWRLLKMFLWLVLLSRNTYYNTTINKIAKHNHWLPCVTVSPIVLCLHSDLEVFDFPGFKWKQKIVNAWLQKELKSWKDSYLIYDQSDKEIIDKSYTLQYIKHEVWKCEFTRSVPAEQERNQKWRLYWLCSPWWCCLNVSGKTFQNCKCEE